MSARMPRMLVRRSFTKATISSGVVLKLAEMYGFASGGSNAMKRSGEGPRNTRTSSPSKWTCSIFCS